MDILIQQTGQWAPFPTAALCTLHSELDSGVVRRARLVTSPCEHILARSISVLWLLSPPGEKVTQAIQPVKNFYTFCSTNILTERNLYGIIIKITKYNFDLCFIHLSKGQNNP